MFRLVDVHCHAYELSGDLNRYKDIIIVGVSDDLESSMQTIRLSNDFENLIPAIGLHPWSVKSNSVKEAKRIVQLLDKYDVRMLGEVGLDRRFVPKTFNEQLEVFKIFLEASREYGLALNIHSVDAWRQVLDLVMKYNVEVVVFHWYTGPLDVLEDIIAQKYYISINPAVKIQEKHKLIVKETPLDYILTESDAPYNYRGIRLSPDMVNNVIHVISHLKGVDTKTVRETIWRNFERLKGTIGM